jgi:hypothetical protein
MKNVFAKGFVKFGLLAVIALIAAGVPTKAQSLQYKLTVNIPFDFTVIDQKMPAGKYTIGRAQLTDGDQIIQISSMQKNESVTRITIPVITRDPVKDGILVFRQYGDEYFLSEIWPAGGHTGRALPRSRTERELERQNQDVKVAKVRFAN